MVDNDSQNIQFDLERIDINPNKFSEAPSFDMLHDKRFVNLKQLI